jgi:hypothetical protein
MLKISLVMHFCQNGTLHVQAPPMDADILGSPSHGNQNQVAEGKAYHKISKSLASFVSKSVSNVSSIEVFALHSIEPADNSASKPWTV